MDITVCATCVRRFITCPIGYNEGKRTSHVNLAGFKVDYFTGYTKSVQRAAI